MTIPWESLAPYEAQLQSTSTRERDLAADELSDYLEYGDMPRESRLKIGHWLLAALWKESDETVLESILHALGAINLPEPCPELPWHRLGDYLEKLQSPLLGEYGLGILGECGDPAMVAFVEPYLQHPEPIVRDDAAKAIRILGKTQLDN